MSYRTVTSAIALSIFLIPIVAFGYQSEQHDLLDDEILIQKSITDYYIKGLQERDFDLIRKV